MVLKGPIVDSSMKRSEDTSNPNLNINDDDDKKEIDSSKRNSPIDSSLGSDGKTSQTSDSETSLTDNNDHSIQASNIIDITPAQEFSSSDDDNDNDDEEEEECLAVHTLERDMPDFDYSHLVEELRERIIFEHKQNPGLYSQVDIDKCCQDDWNVARYLLRQKMDLECAFNMMKRTLRFRNESLGNFIKPTDFPAEFYMVGGTFGYEPDRKGNRMLYIRVKINKKIPEITGVIQGFLIHNLDNLDKEANGRGISVVFDCQGAGLANADVEMLLFIISTIKDYFPKGLSYFLIHELPWILKPIWHMAKTFIPDEYRQLIKFSDSSNVTKYIKRENLPDFMGGTCKRSYTSPPECCAKLEEAAKLWGIEKQVVRKVVNKFAEYLPEETLERIERNFSDDVTNNNYDEDDKI